MQQQMMELFISHQLLLLNCIFILTTLYVYCCFCNSKSKPSTDTFGFKRYPFLGVLPELSKNRHRFLEWTTEVLSRCPTYTSLFKTPGMQAIFTANPLNVEHMLKTKFENYPKGSDFSSVLEDFFGHGVFTSDGALWKSQRKALSYEFNTKSLRHFWMETVAGEIQVHLVPLLENAAKTGRVLDMQLIFRSFAFDNICKAVFNVDLGCLGDEECATGGKEFMHAFDEAAFLSNGRIMYPLKLIYNVKKFFNVGSEKRLKRAVQIAHDFVENQINARSDQRKSEKNDEDLLSRFLANNDHDEFLKDNVLGMILAGGDTSSTALAWFFWLLSSRPEIESKIRQELGAIRSRKVQNNGPYHAYCYDLDDLYEMHYLHAALSESMRLYPPVPLDGRQCKEDDILPDGTFVKKNWSVHYNSYAMARLENIWGKDCCEYKPERWLENNGIFKPENPFRFPIFHAGPRICLGKELAYIQMKSIAATLLERFDLDVLFEGGKPPQFLVSLTLRMKGGLPVRVRDRFAQKFN